MAANPEVIEDPLTHEGLAARYRELCADPFFANLPGKIELDIWGRTFMSQASNHHGILQARLLQKLAPLGGQAIAEASVVTSIGLLVADVAWANAEFMRAHGSETPFSRAPDLCIEIASPSNSLKELRAKVDAYLAAGALEAWVVYPNSRRIELFGSSGALERSSYAVDLSALFD